MQTCLIIRQNLTNYHNFSDPYLVPNILFIIIVFVFIASLICSLTVLLPYLFFIFIKSNLWKLPKQNCIYQQFNIIILIINTVLILFFILRSLLVYLAWFNYFIVFLFLVLLIIGFFYEWQIGAITWIVPEESAIKYKITTPAKTAKYELKYA